MVALLVLFPLLFVIGVAVAVFPTRALPAAKVNTAARRRGGIRIMLAIAVGGLIVLMSSWLLPGIVVGVGTWWGVGGWQRRQNSANSEIARLDALASWIESVRDVLMAGEQPIGAIASSVGACSPLIRPYVRRLATGLSRQDPEIVFRRFADDLDDPVADLVAAGLSIAIRRGARTVPVLSALAQQTREQVDRRRLVEAERAPTRREVTSLTVIMGGLVVALLVFGRSQYLDAYDQPEGQVFLAVALTGYAGLIVRVQKLAAFPRPGRFMTAGQVRS